MPYVTVSNDTMIQKLFHLHTMIQFFFTVVLNIINTNDILQVCWPHKAISPLLCVVSLEFVIHLFLYFLLPF